MSNPSPEPPPSELLFEPEDSTRTDLQTPMSFTSDNTTNMDQQQQQQQDSSHHHHSSHSTPFFADATLDLDEAHDIAETPEATPRVVARLAFDQQPHLCVPELPEHDDKQYDTTTYSTSNNNTTKIMTTMMTQDDDLRLEEASRDYRLGNHRNFTNNNINNNTIITDPLRPVRRPKWPRDVSWAVMFLVVVPLGLLQPLLFPNHTTTASTTPSSATWYTQSALVAATRHTLITSFVCAIGLTHALYRSHAGGSGDVTRQHVTQLMLLTAPLSVAVQILGTIFLWWALPPLKVYVGTLSIGWFLFRESSNLSSYHSSSLCRGGGGRRRQYTSANHHVAGNHHDIMATSETTLSSSRQAFFQALVCMALDVLSRSLRRLSFYRTVTGLIIVQTIVLWLWKWALTSALQPSASWIWLIWVCVAGKWATGTVARILSLIAAGGVTKWFMEQSAQLLSQKEGNTGDAGTGNNSKGYSDATSTSASAQNEILSDIPEAYRAVDASVYETVLDMDDALDDDYADDELELENFDQPRDFYRRTQQQNAFSSAASTTVPVSTVKELLSAGLTTSFGSVAQCGLLGGLAQFVWCQVRKVDAARIAIAQARQAGFQGMSIGRRNATILSRIGDVLNQVARGFVRRFSDLPMSHVAAYYKSYRVAARDVAILIDESGVEQVLHDDISTHMCACVGGTVAGVIVIVTHFTMMQQLKDTTHTTDKEVVVSIFLDFILSYTLLFTAMEPIRASIKAIYISFAQHPRSFRLAYPLIYHRLNRLSETHVVSTNSNTNN